MIIFTYDYKGFNGHAFSAPAEQITITLPHEDYTIDDVLTEFTKFLTACTFPTAGLVRSYRSEADRIEDEGIDSGEYLKANKPTSIDEFEDDEDDGDTK